MNAREAMQALLDGKTLEDHANNQFKLDNCGTLIVRKSRGSWTTLVNLFNTRLHVVEEYPLTFEEAIRAMLDGKVVECELNSASTPRRFHDGVFQFRCYDKEWVQVNCFEGAAQKAKWKVVE